jgi:crotonobetainyl-CoA:carnitine CoA-transferase CaiB-like acyl-CoA transferase
MSYNGMMGLWSGQKSKKEGCLRRPRRCSLHPMPRAALDELLRLAGLPEAAAKDVAIVGSDPVLATRFRVGTAGAAAIAAAAVAAAELWSLRSGEPRQQIAVDVRHATAALRSGRYLRIDGAPPKDFFDPLFGFYATRDGRAVMLHCNFPNHRAAALAVLGLPATAKREDVAAAAAAWNGLALEDAVHGAGGCAALVRSPEDWARHGQAAAVAALPLLEIERIGEAPPEPLPAGERPLSGVRVLDLTRVLAGPTCARTLAEHGADVLKVSSAHLPSSGEMDIDTGLGKLSTFLDLRQATDAETLQGLVAGGRCDVFSQGYRPGALAARGFGAERLAALRPGIVVVELSAWGRDGPWSARRGFDTIVQCASGMARIQGSGQPRLLPVSAIDYVTGYLMAVGAMTALRRRAQEGGSWRVRASLARTGRWIVDRGLLDYEVVANLPTDLPEAEIAGISLTSPSPLGIIRHLAPVARLRRTPARWDKPPVPNGHDQPVWPPRNSP